MRTLLWVVVAIKSLSLLYFLSLRLENYRLRPFELRSNLAHRSDGEGRMLKKLNSMLAELQLLQRIDSIGLLLVITGLLVYLEQSLVGIIYAGAVGLLLWMIAKLSLVQTMAARIFELHYESVCQVAVRLAPVLYFIGTTGVQVDSAPQSRPELLNIIQTLPSTVLLPVERQRVESVLKASEKSVKDIMTPKKRVIIVEPSATLGPIVLSDLQKTGHGYFPVATKKGEPEGILTLSDLADLETAKQRTSVRELMSAHIGWVEEDTSLFELAEAILEEKQYALFVRNQDGEFSGLVTIADLMKHLLGIVKE